ncbi:MAG: O-antigen ligase family protein [Limnohabitans sp.]
MLACLPALFFFAVLMGSPVPGFLLFMLLGIVHGWRSWRQPQSANALVWTRQDSWLALCFMSIPLFKLLTLLWSSQPQLALGNVAWHLYFLFWPLVLIGLARLQCKQQHLDQGLALGLVATAVFLAYRVLLAGDPDARALGNVGITAQLAMAVGGWNLLALTRPNTSTRDRGLYAGAFVATWVVLVFTTRRLELLGFAALSFAIGLYRLQHRLNRKQMVFACLAALLVAAAVMSLRWEKFALGFAEIQSYFHSRAQGLPYEGSSWGARLEMWRLGWQAFTDHPWLGIGASARPHDLPGAPPMDIFGHRHFHSHLMQTAVEGGLLGLLVFGAALAYSTQTLIIRAWNTQRENALLAASLLLAYALEGAASAALVYDKPNALLVVMSCWVWLKLRPDHPRSP